MTKITHEENQINAVVQAGDTVVLTINGEMIKQYTVKAENKALVTFMYQEMEED